MKREDIIRMAREAGISESHASGMFDFLERFAELVAAAEREACAKLCENYTDNHGGTYSDLEGHGYECAEAIRARGNK